MNRIPLAEKMRPNKLSEVIGQEHIIGKNGILNQITKSGQPTSIILWGPAGTGKTTLARIIASSFKAEFIELSAVTSGKKDVEKVIEHARQNWNLNTRTILFVDEIHRFNKAQQDTFLPHVESGLITLIGATTENPSFEVIAPLLSRLKVLTLNALCKADIIKILKRAQKFFGKNISVTAEAVDYLAETSEGDARVALNSLELAVNLSNKVDLKIVEQAIQKRPPSYDKNGEAHYNILSAFIKSLRGGDVAATLYYMSRMIDAGEDPKIIARRMIVFASEDIGLSGNGALSLAVATSQSVERVGLPEASYNLYHCATALARSEKSREIVDLMSNAKDLAKKYPNSPIPLHLRNAPTKLMQELGYAKNYNWETGFKHSLGFLPDDISKNNL